MAGGASVRTGRHALALGVGGESSLTGDTFSCSVDRIAIGWFLDTLVADELVPRDTGSALPVGSEFGTEGNGKGTDSVDEGVVA